MSVFLFLPQTPTQGSGNPVSLESFTEVKEIFKNISFPAYRAWEQRGSHHAMRLDLAGSERLLELQTLKLRNLAPYGAKQSKVLSSRLVFSAP